ncbi:5-bromo-4-chloroindolyl phosphate hydrolysis protein [Saccharicrinis carchari]|uniref:5-bromo-4-chloroindolyl phosphate hydrolysis protein n=1 Tax=Saccharicrinis carchari TaxID=1168039 RepID=A0A521BE79_SACCC|nr:5-bromo-4-chloroindolyl phosphate hydrolysis family protein [Saccharicrinis carchari]SMO45396.1 5-bromo-4-chloroindolyl phosphate hydrolysis protein [Saccharicrinis carchari]
MPPNQNKLKQKYDKGQISGILSILSFVLLFFFFKLPIFVSAIAGAGIFFTLYTLLGNKDLHTNKTKNNARESRKSKLIELARTKLEEIEAGALKLNKIEVQQKIRHICALGYKILDEIKQRPNSIKISRQFLNYYIDATGTIVSKYAALQNNKAYVPAAEISLNKAEKVLGTVESAFEKQLERLYNNDVMDLDVELNVLAKTIKSEGL